ncbi:MAG: S8 family serine peptidase [Anaerolineae bacterium]
MQSPKKSYLYHLWFRLTLIACLALGILGYVPAIAPGDVVLADPPPPPIEEEMVEDQAALDAQPSTSSQPSLPVSSPITHTIHLKSRQFQPAAMDALGVQSLQRLARSDRERTHILVQLDFIPRETAKAELEARGLELLAYVPDYAWIASVPAASPAAALQLPGVTWAGELATGDKLDPAIVADEWGAYNLAPDGTAAVYVAMHRDESLDTGHTLVEAHGGKVTGEVQGINTLIVEMPRDNIRALAAEDAVQWIEPAAPPLGEANDGIRPQIGVDTVNDAPYNLDGTGIDVMVYDGGQVGAHVDFGTRLTVGAGDTSGVSEHATHVAGTVGGSGSNSASQGGSALQWRGMATNVDIISYGYEWDSTGMLFYSNPGDIELDWARGRIWYGADIGTASLSSNIYKNYWSTDCDKMGNYGETSVLMDQIVRGGNSLVGIGNKYIATWAAGNERGSANSCDTYRTTSPPAAAKNPIHVGASNTNNNSMTTFSSWGPTDDGRIKPTIVAGGCQSSGDGGIKSTDNNPVDAYTVMCGTSMATPAVAGSIALMLQHYRDVYNTSGNFWPSTAKAILIQTADDLGNPGPDYQWGFGQVDIHAAVDLISRRAFRQESITQGEVDVYYFIVPDDATPATVSLAWDDYEATLNANPTLINNLDLELVAPSGTVWRPWVLNAASPANNATRGINGVDNQEQVQVPTPEIGTWLVRVKGTTVPQGPQDYSLACEGCKPLNVGVCQSEVAGTMMAAATLPEAEGPMIEEGISPSLPQLPVLSAVEGLSAGELWQQSLEAQATEGEESRAAEREAELQDALAELEAARETGPEAVVALLDTLTGPALDLTMDEIVEAQERLAESAPPPPETAPVSEAEEQAALDVQQAVQAANRAQALTRFDDPAEGQSQIPNPKSQISNPAAPTADLTVGSGCTYATIAAAISAANPGDRLLLEGGVTFVENVIVNKNLTLQGGYDGCASGSTARTTIDGNASGRVFEVYNGLNVTLQNLNITNGNTGNDGGGIRFAAGVGSGTLNLTNVDVYANTATWGGGLWVGKDAEVVGTDVEIYNNTATTYGGGVRLYGGRATFSDYSNIRDNSAPLGGGVYGTLQDTYAPSLDLPSSADVYDNQALAGSGLGGGVYMQEGSLSLTDCSDLYSNDAIHGGGAYLITTTLTIDGSCSEILYNTATGNGGGVYAQGSTVNLDDDAELYNNDAGTDGSGSGGGAYLDDSNLWSDKASIRYNTADDFGGGVYATNTSIVDMDLGSYTCLGARCSRLYANIASNAYGGGIYANNSTVRLDNIFVEYNTAALGGGIYAYNSPVYAYNNLFARNNATSGIGDGIRLYAGSSMSGSGNTLAYNDAGGASTGRAIDLSTSSLTLGCSIVWGHSSSINVSGENVTYSDVQGGYTGKGNLDVNPLFVSSASQDYHLQSTSPVIDRCLSGPSTDFDNERRPIVRETAASPYDMGADEVAGVDRVGVNGACAYGTIQQAVNAASDGDTVRVAAGVYFENVNISGKDITIGGDYDSTCTATGGGTTRIEGSAGSGSTVDVYNGSVVNLNDLQIAWGSDTYGGGVDATGNARVTLDNTDVRNNRATYGGGIYVSSNSAMTITNDSDVHDNTATSPGGGARVWGQFFGYGETSDVYGNCAPDGGGFYVPGGELYLNEADVMSNQAAGATGKGGGIYVTSGGEVNLTNAVFIGTPLFAPYQEAYDGGGIYADNSTVSLDGVDFGANRATRYGGALYLANNSILQAINTRLGHTIWFFITLQYGNSANYGGGLYADDSTVDFSGSIATNDAAYSGGGIYATGSTLNLTDATVGLTGSALGNRLGTSDSYGAGLYLTNGTQATLSNTVVASNTFQGTTIAFGGGAYLANGSNLALINSRIERHLAMGSLGRGAGIYVSGSRVTLDNSQVISNTASINGGGLRLYNVSTLNVLNGSSISYNESLNSEGGGIAATGTPDINISNATLQYNTARTDGGAVYLDSGTLDFTGWWDLRWNHADGNGGAVAVLGTGDVNFAVTDGTNPSLLAVNSAAGDGGALYVGNNDVVPLYALSGYQLNLNTNSAGGSGGAVYAASGATPIVYGQVMASSNTAGGNGGVFYLAGGSVVWLVNYAAAVPQIWVNTADNGGAVYATGGSGVVCLGAEFGASGNGNSATAGDGGAIYLSGSEMIAYNCTFRNSQATGSGGAIYATNTSTVTIASIYSTCDPLSEQCSSLYNNVADSDDNNVGYGGALYTSNSTLWVNHTYLHRNSASYGGAIYQRDTSAVGKVENSLIYSNTVSNSNAGAGIRARDGVFTLTHTTIASNTGSPGFSPANSFNIVSNSIAWNNSGGGFAVGGTYVITSCNIDQSGNVGTNVDPQFVAPWPGEDYHLLGNSPAIDKCATGLTPDLDNALRPAGSAYDMGAYEYPYVIEFAPNNTGTGLPASDVQYTHTLTNAGGLADTYTLTVQSGQGWPVTFTPSPTVTLNAGGSALVSVTVSIPAGVLSGMVDTTVVTATSGGDPSLTANVRDKTLVGFAPSAAFEPDYVRTGAGEGNSFINTHTLTNTGNAQDTFYLAFDSSAGWGSLLTSGPIILNPNQSASVVVTVTVPTGGSGQSDTSVVTVTSAGGAGPVVVHDTTSAFLPGVEFTQDHTQTASPNDVFTHTHTLTNTGNSADTFYLTMFSTLGWGTLLDPGPFALAAYGSAGDVTTVRVRVDVPAGSGGMTDTTTITATSAGGAGPATVRDTTVTFAPDIAFEPDHSQTIPANSTITYTHRLTNTGAGPDTFDLTFSTSLGWGTLLDAGPFALNDGAATDVRVRVDAPPSTGGLTDVTVVTATSQSGSMSGLFDAVTDATTAVRTYGATFTPDYNQAIDPGGAFTYTHQLVNTGNSTDTFKLTLDTTRGWPTLLDTGPFTLTVGAATGVRVRVDVPLDSGGEQDVTTIVATSQTSPTVSASVVDTSTSIYTPSIVLTPDYDQTTTSGSTFTHTHWLTNTGNGSDQFDLSFSSSLEWATLLDPGPFILNASEGITLQVRVDVPVGSGGLVDVAVITATSQSGGLSATATDTSTVLFAAGVEIVPDQAQSVPPDDTYIYVHTLRNTGNGSDTLNVAMSSSLGWATLLDTGPFALGAGETTEVRVQVAVPTCLISGTLTDIAIVTATSQISPTVFDTATDTTTVGFAPGMAFAPDYVTIGASANDIYTYTHWLTNTSNYTDTFDLSINSSAGWGTLLDTGPYTLDLNASTSVRVEVTVPITGDGQSDVSVITATSRAGSGEVAVRDTTAAFAPNVAFASDNSRMASPSELITYTHTLTNTGASTDTISLSLDSSQSWSTLDDIGPFLLASNAYTTVRVLVNVPFDAGGLTDVTTVTAASLAGAGPTARVVDITAVTYTPGITLSPDHTQTVPAGSSYIYTHDLTNTGDGADTFSVVLHSSQGWGALLDTGPFALAAGGHTEIRVQVSVPTDTYPFEVDVTTITATAAIGGVFATDTDTTTVACESLARANFTFKPTAVLMGQSATFTGSVASGSPPVTYVWNFDDSSGQQPGNPIAHTFATTGTFTVVMTASNTCPSVVTETHDIAVTIDPDITVDPLLLNVTANVSRTVTRTLTIGNVGLDTLIWGITEIPTRTWLTELPTGGSVAASDSTPVSVVFDTTGLVSDTYTTTLQIASNDPDESVISVLVTLTVTDEDVGYDIYLPLVLRNY